MTSLVFFPLSARLLLWRWSPIPQRQYESPAHTTRTNRIRKPHCSGLCSTSIYVVAAHVDDTDRNDRIRKLVHELARCFWDRIRQAVAQVPQVEQIWPWFAGGARKAQTREVRRSIVQSFLVLLQISLLLFGVALSANVWYEQRSIACVIITTTDFGFLSYSHWTVTACLIHPSCPFHMPTSMILRMLRIDSKITL